MGLNYIYDIINYINQNNLKQMQNEDQRKVAESIALLPQQIKDVMRQAEGFKFPNGYQDINRVVINGMGGSNLGARIITSVFKEEAKVPILVEPGYQVPGYVDSHTLYIISSYSGSTEEPLSTFVEAKARGAKIVGLTESGKNKLSTLFKAEGLPVFFFNPDLNPSGQPRMGLGYAIFALLVLLAEAGVIKIDSQEITAMILALEKNNKFLQAKDSPAKVIAKKIYGKEVVLIGAEFLEGSLHAWRNQFCETSKNFASYLVLPDLNHYALEGLGNPLQNSKNLFFIFLASNLYRQRIKKRSQLTQEIAKKNKIKSLEIKLKSRTKLCQAAEVLQLGSWITYYLAKLNNVDPVTIKWVDWFKEKLG
jgi:glucose/mannose-6-phosphate isomerase